MHERSKLGHEGESLVVRHIEQQGFKILERNYTRRKGEIDLIAFKHDLLVFIEVKMRNNTPQDFDLSDVIIPSKQKKIVTVAKEYLAHYDHDSKVCRFDVALVVGAGEAAHITYLEDAFRAEDE